MARTQRVIDGGITTWTVVSDSFEVIEPAESYLEFGRQSVFHRTRSMAYARGLAQWWT
jgi:hypothetical protein